MAFAEEIVFDGDEEGGGEFVGHSVVEDKKLSLYGLTQYVEGQRLHPGVPRAFLGTFEGWDYLRAIRENTRARQYEALMVEFRLNGRVHGPPKLVRVKSRTETVELAPERENYSRSYYGQHRNRPRSARRSGGSNDRLLRELIESKEKQHQAEIDRIERHDREMREREQRHQEEVRRLESEKQAEINKRLEEKIAEAANRKEENPEDFKTLLLKLAVEKVRSGDDETANSLVNMVKGDEEGGSGFWALANNVIDKVAENPQGAMQFASSVLQGVTGAHVAPQQQQQPNAQPQQQQPPPPSDMQVIKALADEIAAAAVGDTDPSNIARMVRDVLTERPHLRASVEAMLEQGDEELLAALSATAGVSFEGLGRKPLKWARDFRKVLACYGIGAEVQPQPTEPSNNGHLAVAQAQG